MQILESCEKKKVVANCKVYGLLTYTWAPWD